MAIITLKLSEEELEALSWALQASISALSAQAQSGNVERTDARQGIEKLSTLENKIIGMVESHPEAKEAHNG